LAGLVSGHHEGLDGDTKTRGGLGADDCAIIGRYSRAIGQLSFYLGKFRCEGTMKS